MSKATGGAAFPSPGVVMGANQDRQQGAYEGMTLRDYFAAAAFPGLMARNWSHVNNNEQEIIQIVARSAYAMADAMIAERAK